MSFGWNIETLAKTHVFEHVRAIEARSPCWGLGLAFPHLAMPNHEGCLDTFGVCCRAVFLRFRGSGPTLGSIGPLAQLHHEEGLAVTFSGEQDIR